VRRLLVTAVVLAGLLVAADRVAAAVAANAVADQVVASADLASADVSIGGFPFLTQALGGRYDSVSVVATGVAAGEVTLDRLDATLTGVSVPLSDVLSGAVGEVPVASVRATALVGYAELARRSGDRRLTVAPDGDRLRVTGSVSVLGQTVSASALSSVRVEGGAVVVTAESYSVGDAAASAAISRALGGRFDLRIPVTGLPYGLQVSGVRVTAAGVEVTAAAGATVLVPGRTPAASGE
jgi:hypothetical protein